MRTRLNFLFYLTLLLFLRLPAVVAGDGDQADLLPSKNTDTSCAKALSKSDNPHPVLTALLEQGRDSQTGPFDSEWGTKLLLDADPAWTDPQYLAELLRFAAPQITHYGGRARELFDQYESLFNTLGDGHLLAVTRSGTDANNLLFQIVESNSFTRKAKNFLYFGQPYGGTYGPIRAMKNNDQLRIPSPLIHPNESLSEQALNELIKTENEALQFIRVKVANESEAIGGIFLEPISMNHGMFMFRPEFMLQLRQLADELEIPIMADEILSGGGRSGKFWAYQHYPNFTPDLVTFGKGLVVSGLFKPRTTSYGTRVSNYMGGTTSFASPLVLLQSQQVLKAIAKRNLIENAESVGAYFLKRLQEKNEIFHLREIKRLEAYYAAHQEYKPYYPSRPPSVSGVGLMLRIENAQLLCLGRTGYGGRLLPPLYFTYADVDAALDCEPKTPDTYSR